MDAAAARLTKLLGAGAILGDVALEVRPPIRLPASARIRMICCTMGDYPGRKQVRNRVKRAAKNDRIIAKRAAEKKTAKK